MAFEVKNFQETNFPIFAQPDARDFDILVSRYGIDNGIVAGCLVSVQGPATMALDVSAGSARISGVTVTYAGATGAVTIAAANAINPRLDLVTIDASAVIAVVTGTAASLPLIPALPASKIALAVVWVPANATTVNAVSTVDGAGKVIDKRLFIVARQTSGANLTNNVTSGGSSDIIANFTDLTTYANDAAAIRNDIYQLSRKLKQINDGLRTLGLFT